MKTALLVQYTKAHNERFAARRTSSLVLIVSSRIWTMILTLRIMSFGSQMVASYNVKN
jgi:hypothetical protein